MNPTKNRRRLVIAAAATALVASTASTAFADSYGDYRANGVRIRSCGSTACTTVYGLGYIGDGVTSHCWVFGEDINGDYYWDFSTDQRTGVTGYSWDGLLGVGGGHRRLAVLSEIEAPNPSGTS